jgi:hypothetical protein
MKFSKGRILDNEWVILVILIMDSKVNIKKLKKNNFIDVLFYS